MSKWVNNGNQLPYHLVSLPDFWAINDCIIQVFLHRLDTEVTERSDHRWHAFAFALHLDQAPKKKVAGLEVVKFFLGGVVHDSPRWKQSQIVWNLTLYRWSTQKKCKSSTLVSKSGPLRCFDFFYMLWCTSQCCGFKAVKRSLKRIAVLSTVATIVGSWATAWNLLGLWEVFPLIPHFAVGGIDR